MTNSQSVEAQVGNLRWHNRFVMRKWDGSDLSPFMADLLKDLEQPAGAETKEGFELAYDVTLGEFDQHSTVALRGAIRYDDDHVLIIQDCEALFFYPAQTELPSEKDLANLLRDWAAEYVLGFLRAGVADAARSVGRSAPIVPGGEPSLLDSEEAERLIRQALQHRPSAEITTV